MASIRAKALSRTKISSAVPSTAFFAREVEDQDSGNLTLNHISVEDRFHQPSIRPSTSTMILLCEHPGGLPHPFLISSITQRLPLDKRARVVQEAQCLCSADHRVSARERRRQRPRQSHLK